MRSFRVKMSENIDKLKTLVELNQSTAARNIFCIHPAGGGVSYYEGIAKELSDVAKVYALDDPVIYDDFDYRSLPELAEYHLETIQEVQESGRYTLFGYCSGGPLAYEIAKQLILEGKEVERVVMFGSKIVTGFDSTVPEKYLFLRDYLGARFGLQLTSLDWPSFESRGIPKVSKAIVDLLVEQKVEGISNNIHWVDRSIPALVMMREAQKRYRAGNSSMDIDLYQWNYADSEAAAKTAPWCDWERLTTGRLNMFRPPKKVEDHLDIMFVPYLAETVKKVKAYSLACS